MDTFTIGLVMLVNRSYSSVLKILFFVFHNQKTFFFLIHKQGLLRYLIIAETTRSSFCYIWELNILSTIFLYETGFVSRFPALRNSSGFCSKTSDYTRFF